MKKLIYIIVLQLILTFNYCSGQWYQVNLPVSGSIHFMQFINANTGWLTLSNNYLLRTTNGGINWTVATDSSSHVYYFQFINDTLGYSTGMNYLTPEFRKTTNGGINWSTVYLPTPFALGSINFINSDTGWASGFIFPGTVVIEKTTNGGQTFENLYTGSGSSGGGDTRLIMIKDSSSNEYYGYHSYNGHLYKSSNSGYNWNEIIIPSAFSIDYFSFINKDTGWVNTNFQNTKIYKTTNGGMNWDLQFQIQNSNSLSYIFAVNSNKIWCGVNLNYLLVSTNGGTNWGKQFTPLNSNGGVYMYDSSLGFAWSGIQLVRTVNGGGPITAIVKSISTLPSSINLKQNYPNPFNPSTNIEFQINKSSIVDLKVFDILGRKVVDIINSKEFVPGIYRVSLDMSEKNLAGGVYFYRLTVLQREANKLFNLTKKMIYNK